MKSINPQNKALFIIFISILVVLAAMFFRGSLLKNKIAGGLDVTDQDPSQVLEQQEQMGETLATDQTGIAMPNSPSMGAIPAEDEKTFAAILEKMNECLELKAASAGEKAPLKIETIMDLLRTNLGESNSYDRWQNWHLKNKEGVERRIRLEVIENDEGKISRELHYYGLDKEGLPIPLELEKEKSYNPSDDTINLMLKEGEVFYKEKASGIFYSTGERIEFVEKNGQLAQIEASKGDRFFRCQNLTSKESCQCVK